MVQWLGLSTFTAVAPIQSLLKELKSQSFTDCQKKKKKTKPKKTIYKKPSVNIILNDEKRAFSLRSSTSQECSL